MAVNSTRRLESTSPEVTEYEVPVAPAIVEQPLELHRSQLRVNVIGAVPDQLPFAADITFPTSAVPLTLGATTRVGAVLGVEPPLATVTLIDAVDAWPPLE